MLCIVKCNVKHCILQWMTKYVKVSKREAIIMMAV